MARTKILIRGRDGNAKYYGNVKGGLKLINNDTNGMPGGYHINGKDSTILPGTWYRSPQRFIVYDEGNPNPVPFTGELPDVVVVGEDGRLLRSVQVGILCGPLIGNIAKDGLNARKNPMQWDWRILAAVACGIAVLGYVVGQSGLRLW